MSGARSGIGAVITLALAAQGADVVAVSSPEFRLDRFTSLGEVRQAQEIGAALALLTLEPPGALNGRILRYDAGGWERTNR